MDAYRAGREPEPPAGRDAMLRTALFAAMARDADAFRGGLEVIGCLAQPEEVLARPGMAERVMALRSEAPAVPAPARDEVLRLVA
jgi:hypothetical protein